MMNNLDELYRFLYNKLVEISNAEVFTIHYLIGPKWKVCNASDTVVIARNTISYFKEISNDIKTFEENKIVAEKIRQMLSTLATIANAKPDKWDDGLFDVKYYYYADDTVYKASKCLKILTEYI
jgi:hypothetical protein